MVREIHQGKGMAKCLLREMMIIARKGHQNNVCLRQSGKQAYASCIRLSQLRAQTQRIAAHEVILELDLQTQQPGR